MKLTLCLAATFLAAGISVAQQPAQPPSSNPQAQPQSQPQTQPTQTPTQSRDRTQSTEPNKDQSKEKNQTAADTKMQSGKPAEMKTQTFKGELVDASCAGGAASTTPSASANPSSSSNPSTPEKPASTTTANRSKSDTGGSSCGLTSSATAFALRTSDGRVVPFDMVGNQRVQDAMKTRKKWSESMTANKPIKVNISGVMSGEKLVVSSIH